MSTNPKRLSYTLLALGLVGILDTAYLVAKHYVGGTVKCILAEGCDTVITSSYSMVLGVIPAALLGLLFYSTLFVGVFLVAEDFSLKFRRSLLVWAGLGLAFSGWFLYVQAFILDAYCTYCLISALNTLLIFITSVLVYRLPSRT